MNKTVEYEYIRRYQQTGDKIALEALIKGHAPWIFTCCTKASKQFRDAVEMTDLIQTATVGFITGIQRFDLESGYRLLTYATFWIRAELFQTYANSMAVHIPVHRLREMCYSDDKMRAEEINRTYERALAVLSLNHNIDDSESEDVLLKASEFKIAFDQTVELFMKYSIPNDVKAAIDSLPYLQRQAFWMRAGLDFGGQYTISEIAELLNITEKEVTAEIRRARHKLRREPALQRLATKVA